MVFVCCFGCSGKKPIVAGKLIPPPPPTDIFTNYQSTVTAASFGQVTVSGYTDNGSSQPYNTSQASPAPDAALHLNAGSGGDEQSKSCGVQGNNSAATSSASFDAQNDTLRKSYGFAVSADTFAKGGFWRGKTGFLCSGSNNTQGDAAATSSGTIRLTYAGGLAVPDRLIIRTTSSGATSLQFFDAGGVPLQSVTLADNTIVTLQHPGPYSIVGTVDSHVNDGADGKKEHRALSVSIQSMRDALSLGYTGSVNEAFKIPLPVFVGINTIKDELNKNVFNNDGKFYPCPSGSDCFKQAGGLYLEWPEVSTAGAWLVLKAHLSGHVAGFMFFSPGVTGEITAYGVPVVEDNVLKLDKLYLETQSANLIVNIAEGRFSDRLTSELQKKAHYDLAPLLDKEKLKINKQFPIRWGQDACLAAQLDSLDLSSVIPMTSPDGVQVNFRGALGFLSPDKCAVVH